MTSRLWDTVKGDIPASYAGTKHVWDTKIGDLPTGINPSATSQVQWDTYLGEVNVATGLPQPQ